MNLYSRRRLIYSQLSSPPAQPTHVIRQPVRWVPRSTADLFSWSRRRDSNPEPAVYKTAALPIELRRRAPRHAYAKTPGRPGMILAGPPSGQARRGSPCEWASRRSKRGVRAVSAELRTVRQQRLVGTRVRFERRLRSWLRTRDTLRPRGALRPGGGPSAGSDLAARFGLAAGRAAGSDLAARFGLAAGRAAGSELAPANGAPSPASVFFRTPARRRGWVRARREAQVLRWRHRVRHAHPAWGRVRSPAVRPALRPLQGFGRGLVR